jgi:hypothetical protein
MPEMVLLLELAFSMSRAALDSELVADAHDTLTPTKGDPMDWLDEAAVALEVEPLGRRESADLLKAGRDVAHSVERRTTPLAAFLVGASVQRRLEAGTPREEAFAQALSALRRVIPSQPIHAEAAPADAPTTDPNN